METLARLVLPIPPPPRNAIQGVSCLRILMISNSVSQPWKILGLEGSNENEFKLWKGMKKEGINNELGL